MNPARRGASSASVLVALVIVCALGIALASGAAAPLLDQMRSWFGSDEVAPTEPEFPEATTDARRHGPRAEAAPRPTPTVSAAPRRDDTMSPSELNEAAVAALDRGDLDRAIKLLAEAVTARPDVEVYSANLGEAYLRRARDRQPRDAAGALADFELALRFTTDDGRREQIRVLRDKAKAIAETEKEFVVEPTLHFTFKFDGTRDEILDGVEELKVMLESTYQDYGDLFRHRPVEAGEDRIEVVLYRAEGFDKVTGLGDWAGGVFDGTIRVPAEDLSNRHRLRRLEDVLRHEVAHAFTWSIGGADVPSWLNEGIAQWLESPARRDDSVRIARARLAAARRDKGRQLFALESLAGSLVSWKDKSEISRAYDQALAFTDYLARQYGEDLLFEMAGACKAHGRDGAKVLFKQRILDDLSVVLADFGDTLE